MSTSGPLRAADGSQQASNEVFTLQAVLRALHQDVSAVVDANTCFFGVYDDAEQIVEIVWQVHDGVELAGGAFPLGSGLTSQVIRERQPRLVQQWSQNGPTVQVQFATEKPALPESAITLPVLADDRVVGVVSVQSDRPGAFEPQHVKLVQDLIDRAKPTLLSALASRRQSAHRLNSLVANARDATIAVDNEARLVGLNQAARTVLGLEQQSLLFGFPIDRPQAGRWPLGSPTVTDALRPIVDQLQRHSLLATTELDLHSSTDQTLRCRASIVRDGDHPIGAVMTFQTAS